MIKEFNFDEFSKTSKSQWNDKLNQDLGPELAHRISNWQCERELSLSAYYNQEDTKKELDFPKRAEPSWKYLQPLGPNTSNKEVLDGLMNGADGIILNDQHVGKLNALLAEVAPEHCTIGLMTTDIASYEKFISWGKTQSNTFVKGEFFLFSGDKDLSDERLSESQAFWKLAFEKGSSFGHRTLHVDCGKIQGRGGSSQLELSYMLSELVYCINSLLDKGHSIDQIAKSLFISTSVGSSYFLELSKIRVMRLLANQLLKQYGVSDCYIPIHATTSSFSKSALDPNSNFLRSTSEGMSAVLGGVDFLSIEPEHDLKSTDRIARNISNLLKEESHLGKVLDPAAGSYYMESLSHKLAKEAWSSFQALEKLGGFATALKRGYFQQELEKDKDFQQGRITGGGRKIVGVNDFGNQDEQIPLARLETKHPSLAQDFQEVRRSIEIFTEANGSSERPAVYLMGVGSNKKMINARFTFVANFFSWAGFSISKEYTPNGPKKYIIVLCGADDDYSEFETRNVLPTEGFFDQLFAAGRENSVAPSEIKGWINGKTDRLNGVKSILTQMDITVNSSKS